MLVAVKFTRPIHLTEKEVRERVLNPEHLWHQAHLFAQKIGLKVSFDEQGELTIEGVVYPFGTCANCIIRRGCGIVCAIKEGRRNVFWRFCAFPGNK